MLKVSAALFALSAVGGLLMASIRIGKKINPPAWLAMLHGLMAASGLTLLAYAAFTATVPAFAQYALGLFVVAALGGLLLNLRYQWRNLPLPIGLMILHALVAVSGFVLLLLVVCGSAATA
ncbi:MAG TPA: hypothetical protein VGT79_10885 [Xanthomonadaceae bacterium]|nr:hypothetical protein [Xanthomonadaceae bacterium]